MKMNHIVPRKTIGNISFNYSERKLKSLGYREVSSEYDEITQWKTYSRNKGVDCYVKHGKIVCIACFRNCYFFGRNLIGKTQTEINQIIGMADEIGDDVWVDEDVQQTPHEYFDLGLQLWFERKKVVSVFCNSCY
jgi:hypothetical protein